ncbi:MAG: lamin tail domain-containing protein [Deltaproteobacteria bacterium]|nr:MAG: lamin tail domain-containing protein [Deltaproteobacteria bacterium]
MLCKPYRGHLGTVLVALALALFFGAGGTHSKALSGPTEINPKAASAAGLQGDDPVSFTITSESPVQQGQGRNLKLDGPDREGDQLLCKAKVARPHGQSAFGKRTGTVILNEMSPWGGRDNVWVELINPTEVAVSLKGWSLRFLSGAAVPLPEDAPDCAAGALVLVRFGRGKTPPRLKDRTVHVQLPLEPQLNPRGDGCILEGPQGPVDGLSWGRRLPGKYPPLAVGASMWPPYGVLRADAVFRADDVCIRLPHTWPPTTKDWVGSRHWVYRSGAAATPGKPNAAVGPTVMTPSHGARIASRFSLAVLGMHWAGRITFQVARDAEFKGLVLEKTVKGNRLPIHDLAPGTYYWRVRGLSHTPGLWSGAQSFTVLPSVVEGLIKGASGTASGSRGSDGHTLASMARPMRLPPGVLPTPDEDSDAPGVSGEEAVASHVIGCSHVIQGKDTDMVCLDGCPRDGDASWEDPHLLASEHGDLYCSRASLAMIASLAGCTLSQDRISYYIFEEADPPTRNGTEAGDLGNPFADLGHHMGTHSSSCVRALEWIYGQPVGTASSFTFGHDAFDDGDPADMDTIREFIDDGRPLMRILPDHSTVVDGYRIMRNRTTGEERILLRVLDPAREDPFTWFEFGSGGVVGYLAPPRSGAPMRCDEPGVSRDEDGDMLVDFDETERLRTDPRDPDSDGDMLPDMIDMYGYLFDRDGNSHARDPDFDGDTLAKEVDPDNDRAEDDGVNDGCEDVNLDGYFDEDGTESDNFNTGDDFTVISEHCFDGYIRIEGSATGPLAGQTTTTRESILIRHQPSTSRDYPHRHTWEIQGSATVSFPAPVGSIRSDMRGEAVGGASVRIEVDDEGHYKLVTDCNPRIATYTVATTGSGTRRSTRRDFHLYLADHHFDYVSPNAPPSAREWIQGLQPPNVFEGRVEKMPGGGVRLAGSDTVSVPVSVVGPDLRSTSTRTWEVLIRPGERR